MILALNYCLLIINCFHLLCIDKLSYDSFYQLYVQIVPCISEVEALFNVSETLEAIGEELTTTTE